MDVREKAIALANVDGDGWDDVEFAETFVLMRKIWETENNDYVLTKEDMNTFDAKAFGKWIGECLDEILNSEETDASAWWKQKGE